jgi:hypothetical protein
MGYAIHHAGDVYRMYNPETHVITDTRDIVWGDWHGGQSIPDSLKMFAIDVPIDVTDDQIVDDIPEGSPPGDQAHLIPDDDEDDPGPEAGRNKSVRFADQAVPEDAGAGRNVVTTENENDAPPLSRLQRELAKLNTSYNPTSAHIEEDDADDDEEEIVFENSDQGDVQVHYVFSAALASDPGEPKTLGEALQSKERMYWIEGAKKEIENFLKRGVWEIVPLQVLKKGQRPISTKWVFKEKTEHDGSKRYKGRIVVRGFVQIPGIDFNQTHSPVATDVSIKIVISISLFYGEDGWEIEMLDIEAAFLEAELEEDVYIEWPEGLVMFGYFRQEDTEGTCIKLKKAMYGTVQAPLAFWKENAKHLLKMGMIQSRADPCVWFKLKDGKLWLIIAVYVDDIVYTGSPQARKWFKEQVKTRFNIADLGLLSKHLGVWYQKKKDKSGTYFELSMSKYQGEIVSDYEEATGNKVKTTPTPGFPGDSLIRDKTKKAIDIENYRKILGKAMWFTRKVMPECCNAIRELASGMDHPGEDQWKALGRLIGYISMNDPATLILRKPRDLKVYGYVDSNWATNKADRRSVSGYILTLGGCLVNWVSKTQATVALSSTEAEYVAASMCATEIKFIQMLLEETIPGVVTRPATVLEDNTGCIHLMENQTVGNRTKHIDIKMHHIREMMTGTDPRMIVKFTRSELNFADPMTKNVTELIHRSLVPAIKDGRIADTIFATVNREDVRKSDSRTSDSRQQDPKYEILMVESRVVSSVRDDRDPIIREYTYYSSDNPLGSEVYSSKGKESYKRGDIGNNMMNKEIKSKD